MVVRTVVEVVPSGRALRVLRSLIGRRAGCSSPARPRTALGAGLSGATAAPASASTPLALTLSLARLAALSGLALLILAARLTLTRGRRGGYRTDRARRTRT